MAFGDDAFDANDDNDVAVDVPISMMTLPSRVVVVGIDDDAFGATVVAAVVVDESALTIVRAKR